MYALLVPSKIYSLIRLPFLCPLLDYRSSTHTSPTHPFLSCLVNPASLLSTQDPEAEHLSHDCVQTLDMTLNPFEHITDQPLSDPKVPSWFIRWHCPKTSPIWGWICYSSETARQSYPPTSSNQPHSQLTHPHSRLN